MAIDQRLLLWAASMYREGENLEFLPHGRIRHLTKRRVYVSHATEAFRMVEGFIVLMRSANIDAYYDWSFASLTDEERSKESIDEHARIDMADVFVFLATEQSIQAKHCLEELEYADMKDCSIYIVPTKTSNTYWSPSTLKRFNELSIEFQSRTAGRFVARIREKERPNLWIPISSAKQL